MINKRRYFLKYIPLILLFCGYIYIPLIVNMASEDRISSSQENRNLYQLPGLPKTVEQLREFPRKMDNYYSDHFGFREELNKVYFTIMNHFKFSSAERGITQGQDGWLFLGSIRPGLRGYSDPMGDAMNINLYTQSELEQFAQYKSAIKQWLELRGIEYIYVITPIKHNIYFDKMPQYIERKNDKSATDQLVEHLRKNTDITVVDLRDTLLQERKIHKVYYQTDSHWNSYGANAAQYEIMQQVDILFPGKVRPFKLKPEQFEITHITNGDLARSANMTDAREESPKPIFDDMCNPVNENPEAEFRDPFTMVCNSENLNAIIFRDSFFSKLEPYFSRQFNRSTYIWNRLDYTALTEYIEKENPDIVIDQVVERTLPYMPRGKPFVDAMARQIEGP